MDGTIRLWDLATGRTEHVLSPHAHYVQALAFTPGGRRLISAGEDHTIRFAEIGAA